MVRTAVTLAVIKDIQIGAVPFFKNSCFFFSDVYFFVTVLFDLVIILIKLSSVFLPSRLLLIQIRL